MNSPSRFTHLQAIEGFYVSLILDGFHREGVLAMLKEKAELTLIAAKLRLDESLLRRLLIFVSSRCQVLDSDGHGGFVLNEVENSPDLEPLLDLYVGGFGPCLQNLPRLLHHPAEGEQLVNWQRHGDAFSGAQNNAPVWLLDLIESLQVRRILDLGCGGGQLLCGLARRMEDFEGIGIDANANVLAQAKAHAAEEGLSGRLRFHHGDVLAVAGGLSEQDREKVDLLVASSLVNAYFCHRSVDDLLSGLQTLFPGKVMLITDYYGKLGHGEKDMQGLDYSLLHDLAQLVSGQGVPPPNLEAWKTIYARNSCTLVQAVKARGQGVERFMHMVQL